MRFRVLPWPGHAFAEGSGVLIYGGLTEDEQVLMHDEQEVLIARQIGPQSFHGGVPLGLDDVLFEDEPGPQEGVHDPIGDGNVVLSPPGVSHEDGAVVVWFQHPVRFCGHTAQIRSG